jgi:predicted MFS family arabinose efflux permease
MIRRLLRSPPFALAWLVGLFEEVAYFLLVNVPGKLLDLGVSEAGIGLAYSAGALATLLLRPLFGRLLDQTHRRTVLRYLGFATALATVLLGVIDEIGVVLWLTFLAQRILQMILFTTLLTYVADALPVSMRTQGLAVFGVSGLLPIALSNLLGDALRVGAGYDGVIFASAVAGLISWLLAWRLPLLPIAVHEPRRSFWAVVQQRNLLPLWWVTLAIAMGMEAILTFMRPFVETRGVISLGVFFAVYGFAAISARFGAGGLSAILGERVTIALAVAGQAAGVILLAFASGPTLAAIGAVAAGSAHGLVFPILSSQVVQRARAAERGSAVVTFTATFDVGLLIVAPIVGLLIADAGYTVGFGTLGVTLLLGGLGYLVLDRRFSETPMGDRLGADLATSSEPTDRS